MAYQVGHLTDFAPDDPLFDDIADAYTQATLASLQHDDQPYGVWDMTGNAGELIAVAVNGQLFD